MRSDFVNEALDLIASRKKMTSSLYQVILSGQATHKLLKEFVIHRYPIKNLWTRNLMGVASRLEDYELRKGMVENIYEEETGGLTGGGRHLNSFLNFGRSLGVTQEDVENREMLPETAALVDHNLRVCNDDGVHFTQGVASVFLLMEGQPPIVNEDGASMETVMRDVYGIPKDGHDFFTHHASANDEEDAVSPLEDEHASNMADILRKYCDTPELQVDALKALEKAIDLRHQHFDAIYEKFYDESEPVYRWSREHSVGAYL